MEKDISVETFTEVLTCFYVSVVDYGAFKSNFNSKKAGFFEGSFFWGPPPLLSYFKKS